MAKTILQRWTDSFSGEENAPDASRDKTSNQVNRVTNTLSDRGIGMNNWTSLKPVQPGRYSQKIALLWDLYLGEGVAAQKSTDAGDIGLKDAALALGDIKFDGGTYGSVDAAGNALLNGIARNNNIRAHGVTDAMNAFQTGKFGGATYANRFGAFFAGMDAVTDISNFVKNNYRMAAANPNGDFSNFTAHAFTDSGSKNGRPDRLPTTTLDTLAPTQ